MQDISLKRNPATGRFTFDWSGDLKFDDLVAYSVLTTLYTRKGSYYWDSSGQQGTLIYQVRNDKFSTGSQLAAYAQDAGDQCIRDSLIQAFSSDAQKIRTGSYLLNIHWEVGGKTRHESVRV